MNCVNCGACSFRNNKCEYCGSIRTFIRTHPRVKKRKVSKSLYLKHLRQISLGPLPDNIPFAIRRRAYKSALNEWNMHQIFIRACNEPLAMNKQQHSFWRSILDGAVMATGGRRYL